MSGFTAFFDTNVLVRGSVRDLLMQLASTGTFRAKISPEVLHELEDVLVNRMGKSPILVTTMIENMQKHALDQIVEGYQATIDGLELPDQNDRHVLAAAIHGGAGVIVTYNLKHFPPVAVDEFGIEVQHPDEFIANLIDLHPADVVNSVKEILKRLKRSPKTPKQLLEKYALNELVKTSLALEAYFVDE